MSNTMKVCIYGVSSEALMFSAKEYCGVSNGSACNTNSYKPSFVLTKTSILEERIENSICISWGSEIVMKEIEQSIGRMLEVAKKLVG